MGIDVFRILCCIGVLCYHIMDDVLNSGGVLAKGIYFAASFGVPGFFLMAGYLLGGKDRLDMDYCENKVCYLMKKLFAWVALWSIVHYMRTGAMYDLWENFMSGVSSGGILPVAWFLFTYCFLIILGYPFFRASKKYPRCFLGIAVIWMSALAMGAGGKLVNTKTQSLWLHLYGGYFCLGCTLHELKKVLGRIRVKIQVMAAGIIHIGCLCIYAIEVKYATQYMAPHRYYGKWFYSGWMIALFWLVLQIRTDNKKLQDILSRVASNTFVVYLGHLPALVFVTSIYPIKMTWIAVGFIFTFFVGFEVLAELFRKIPLLRKLV